MSHAGRPYSTFPSSDRAFRRAVEIAVAQTADLTALAAVLRVDYPRVRIVEQSAFASYGEEPLAVYVFREGSFAPAYAETDSSSEPAA